MQISLYYCFWAFFESWSFLLVSKVEILLANFCYLFSADLTQNFKMDFFTLYFSGTRFNIRGVDDEGEVANFVETEQIIFYGSECCSFLQVQLFHRLNLSKLVIFGFYFLFLFFRSFSPPGHRERNC